MGNGLTIEQRANAERLYVIGGVTVLTELERRTGVTRQTLSKWKVEDDWHNKRKEFLAHPEEAIDRVKVLLHRLMDEIDEKIKNKKHVSDLLLERMAMYVDIMKKLDGAFDNKGSLIRFCNYFVDFVAARPKDKKILVALKRLMPDFINHVEKES